MIKRILSVVFTATMGFASVAAANSSWDPATYDRYLGMRVSGGSLLESSSFPTTDEAIKQGQARCDARRACDHFDIHQPQPESRSSFLLHLYSGGQRSFSSNYQTYTKLNRDLSIETGFQPLFCTGKNGDGICSASNAGPHNSAIVKVNYNGNGVLHGNVTPFAVSVYHVGARRACRGRTQVQENANPGFRMIIVVNFSKCIRNPGRPTSVRVSPLGWRDINAANNRHVFR